MCCACQAFKGFHPAQKGRAWDSIKSFASTYKQIRHLVSSSLYTKAELGVACCVPNVFKKIHDSSLMVLFQLFDSFVYIMGPDV
jgi:hypothetical protein